MAQIMQGTTQSIVYKLPYPTLNVAAMHISFVQGGKSLLEKTDKSPGVIMSGDQIQVSLTQEDTLKFSPNDSVLMQLRVRSTDGSVIGSEIEQIIVADALFDGVI